MSLRNLRSQRLYLEDPLEEGGVLLCTPSQKQYLINVLRMKSGDRVRIFNGRQGEWEASLDRLSGHKSTLTVLSQVRSQDQGGDLHYLFAPLKRSRLDYLVQKAVEMGVSKLCPVLTDRSCVLKVNTKRMRANAIEAAEQCGILRIPDISQPCRLRDKLADWESGRRLLFCDENAPKINPLDVLKTLTPGPLALLVGPEGGFEPMERADLLSYPHTSAIWLGPRVMRADTAAVSALAIVNATIGDWCSSSNAQSRLGGRTCDKVPGEGD